MNRTRQFLLVSAVAAILSVNTSGGAQEVHCSGTVTDAAGHPLAGATVEYWGYDPNPLLANGLELKTKTTTETNGAFAVQVSRTTGVLLARKPGLAPAWIQLNRPSSFDPDTDEHLALTSPAALAGVVVDEADKPVANAEVYAAWATCEIPAEEGGRTTHVLSSKPARDCFSARTDAAGHFRIDNFPTNATAILAVRAPGKVVVQSRPNSSWRAGQDDIKLAVEPAGSIEGKIIVEGNHEPPPAARLTLLRDGPSPNPPNEREPAISGPDGAFHFSEVAAGSYQIRAAFGTKAVPEWVSETAQISVESGQPTRDVELTAMRGGLVEVSVLGENDRKPIADVMVYASKENTTFSASSDSNGHALLRLPLGDYQIFASLESMNVGQTSASAEAGQTNRVEIEIAPPQKIIGIVRQPDGHPAAGVKVRMINGFGPWPSSVKTDAEGKFEFSHGNQRRVGRNGAAVCLLVRDVEHNLAVAQEIDEDTGPLDLKLAPGLTLAGKVESDGKPVTNATATLMFWTGQNITRLGDLSGETSTPGRFEITALPPGRKYGVVVSAPGYGQKSVSDVNASEEAGRMELETTELKLATLKLAGQVLDEDDKPVAGVIVRLNGNGQPNGSMTTDSHGRFDFLVCEGRVRLFANSPEGGNTSQISAEAGDTNVILQLGQNNINGASPHKLKGTVTDAGGQPAAGAQVAVLPSNGSLRWTKTAANGGYKLTWSLQPWQMQQGGAWVIVRDPAHNLAATAALEDDITNLDLKPIPATRLTGVVRSTNGSPLAGAQVRVSLKAGNTYEMLTELTAASDAQGRYEIKCLPVDASYQVFASAKGHGQGRQEVAGDSATNRVELSPFVLKLADRVLAGQVLDEDDKPVSYVNVSISGDDQPNSATTTDSKGRFHFKVSEGQVRLFANPPQGGMTAQTSAEAGDTNVVLQFGQNNNNGAKAHKLKGTVTDAGGQPATGAKVTVFPSNGQQTWRKTATNGAFSLTWSLQSWQRQPGGAWLVALDSKLNQGAAEELDEEATNLEVKLKPALTVTGLIKNADGSPLAGAPVMVEIRLGNTFSVLNEQAAASDAQGRYQIKGLPVDASYLLFASAKGYGQRQQQVPADSDTNRVELAPFVLRLADRVLSGQVLDADDKPVSGSSVSISGDDQPSDNMTTDSKGRFHFKVCEGQVRLYANPPQGGMSAQTSAEAGDTNVVLQFGLNNMNPGSKAHKLKGIVTDADGQPVAGAQMAVFPSMGQQPWTKTAANGAFRLTWSLPPWQMQQGGALLVVRAPALNLGAATALDEDTTNLDVKLKPALTMTGLVKNADDSPLAGAQVSVQIKVGNNYDFLGESTTASDAQGHFQIKGLPPDAAYLVFASAKGHGQSQQPVKGGSATDGVELMPFVLNLANRALAGQLLDEDDKPVADATVSVSGLDQPSGNTTTDSKGRFHFQVCEGEVYLNANNQQGGFAQTSAKADDTNVVLQFGQNNNNGAKAHILKGTVTDAEGKPLAGAQLAVFPSFGQQRWSKSKADGAFKLNWSLQPWQFQQGGNALLVARDLSHNLAAAEELQETMTNLDLKMKPALALTGLVKNEDGSPLAGVQVSVQIKAGNTYSQLIEQTSDTDAQGRYQIKCLPPDAAYFLYASAAGHGASHLEVPGNSQTNRLELSPLVLKLANRELAGQVLNEKDKPVAGANVSLNGVDQPNANVATDSKGRFHFQVCDGEVTLFANSPMGGGFAQATAEAGDKNVVLTLGVQGGMAVQRPRRPPRNAMPLVSLLGHPLPDLASVNLDAIPGGQAALLCLFDAGQLPSRQAMRQLNEQAGALRQQGVVVRGVQAAVTDGEIFNGWKSDHPVSFPVGRATEKSEKTKWVLDVPTLPWLILTDARHHVVSEGFMLEDLEAELKKLSK